MRNKIVAKYGKIVLEDIQSIVRRIEDQAHLFSGKTVFLAGGAGFIGKYITYTLDYLNQHVLKDPCTIIVADNYISGVKDFVRPNAHLKLMKLDISKPFTIEGPVDYILHLASMGSPIFYNKFPLECIDAGFLGTKNLLELARAKQAQSFLFFSSSEVYGNPDPKFIPTNEEYNGNVSCTGPRACYDEPKRIGETLCVTYADIYKLPIKIVRPFNIYGPGMRLDDGRVVANFVSSALRGNKIPVYGDGAHTRTFCYITDGIVAIFKVLLSQHNRESFNIGSDDQEIQIRHLAEIVQSLIETSNPHIQNIQGPNETYNMKVDPNRRCPDLGKIRKMLGYTPEVRLVTGLKRFIEWAREEINRQNLSYGQQKKCRSCSGTELLPVASLGKTPLANNLIDPKKPEQEEELYPLEVVYCADCHLSQLSFVVPPEKMFKHYVYVTSTTETFRKHFKNMAEHLISQLKLNDNSLVVDVGSNDGLLLKTFKEHGVRVTGVEPAANIAILAREQGIDTINDFFNENVVKDIVRVKGKADLITANNVFAHIHNSETTLANVKDLLKENGVFCIEVQYLLDTLQQMTFDNIYHEHLSYFCVLSLQNLFHKNGLEIFRVEHNSSHGGTIRVFAQKQGSTHHIHSSVQEFLQTEKEAGLDSYETYKQFGEKISHTKEQFLQMFAKLHAEGKKVVGYGAPAKATTLLNFYSVTKQQLPFIVEDNQLKCGLVVPGPNIPIVGKDILNSEPIDFILILAWNFAEEIMRKNSHLAERGIQFLVSLPECKIIKPVLRQV